MRNIFYPPKHPHAPTNKTSSYVKSNSILLRQQGFSLIELLLGTALISILLYGIGTLMTIAATQNEALTNKIKSEAHINEVSFYLKHFASMGINVEYVPGANLDTYNGTGAFANIGWVRGNYDLTSIFNPLVTIPAIDTIGFFLRDTLGSNYIGAAPAIAARYLPTGIYFQRPTPTTYGVLYIDLGATQPLSASRDDLWFGSIVDFKAVEPEYVTFNVDMPDIDQTNAGRMRLSSVTFKVTMREYFPRENGPRDYKWCPQSAMNTSSLCRTTTPYHDVERVIRVVFRNNVIGFSTAQMEVTTENPTPNRPIRRPLNRRPFDLVYFLKPSYPSGQLKRY